MRVYYLSCLALVQIQQRRSLDVPFSSSPLRLRARSLGSVSVQVVSEVVTLLRSVTNPDDLAIFAERVLQLLLPDLVV